MAKSTEDEFDLSPGAVNRIETPRREPHYFAPSGTNEPPIPAEGNKFNPVETKAPRRLLGQLSSEERKKYPMASGLLDYFPDALAYVAHVSWKGNDKHNPGQPLHWARGKSMDHPDCIVRHLVERGEVDDAGIEHAGSLAWRALAELQQLLEIKHDLDKPRAAVDVTPRPFAKP